MNSVKIEKILAPVDFSEASVYALKYAKLIGERFGAKIYMFHCITDINSYVSYIPSFPAEEVIKGLREDATKEMENLKNRYNINNCEMVIDVGEAAAAIVEFAKKNEIDLIVMGAHGKSGLERFMFGSVTERVMRMCDRPVLEVKAQY